MNLATLYSENACHVLFSPAGRKLDIKKTSYKKVSSMIANCRDSPVGKMHRMHFTSTHHNAHKYKLYKFSHVCV